ncbi:cupin-like domain-containing protein [Congregibacter variabilis]|uniref:Cupin-like domain-containing protein n=1 Tax=Congregibacter variabilis TaxID=3081200 RepID=A0ABZ0I6J6_9GAMM|nr:cupin-like domain-containing protein [Congregibacter sp. IMCC43200]
MANTMEDRLLPQSTAVSASNAAEVGDLPEFLDSLGEPHVIRGLVGHWPLVEQGLRSRKDLGDYLLRGYSGAPLITSSGSPAIKGRIGYNADFTGFNCQRTHMQLDEFFAGIESCAGQDEPPTLYIGSSLLDHWFPGIAAQNAVEPSRSKPLASLWLGNRVVVSAHFDFPDNLACCVAGRRRFTLFPPEQLENLYVGPWDVTPAGQPISLVDMRHPDLDRFPRFVHAMAAAREVILEPGDALFIPSMWWHHVEGLDDLNVLLNYWWRSTPAYMGTPMNVLKHAFLTIKSLPAEQRHAWRDIFDYYVFEASDETVEHIPESGRGMHGAIDENRARALRAELLNALNR